MVRMVSLVGFNVDAQHLPRPIQEEAFEMGLIPDHPNQTLT